MGTQLSFDAGEVEFQETILDYPAARIGKSYILCEKEKKYIYIYIYIYIYRYRYISIDIDRYRYRYR